MAPADKSPASVSSSTNRRTGLRRGEDRRLLRRERELEAARRMSEALAQHLSTDELVGQTLRTALEVIGAEGGSILLAVPDAAQLVFFHSIGPSIIPAGTAIPWDEGIAGEVFQSALPILIRDAASDVRHYKRIDELTGFTTHDLIALPLKRWEGQPIGVMEVLNKRHGRLGEEDLNLLSIMAALAAIAIERARLYEAAKLAEIARLVGDIGHDIKNMLMPITCGTELLESKMKDLLRATGRLPGQTGAATDIGAKVTAMVRRSTRRIQDRMKEIADCVKGRSSPPNFAPCDIRHVIKAVYETLGWVADEKKVVLRTDGLDDVPMFLADEHRLFNAFYNLVNNAIAEVPPGGSVTVSGRLESPAATVVLDVQDTGCGMTPEVRDSLFTPRARTTKSGGTGLGTKIVKDVVDAHGGTVHVTSEIGRGSTFRVCLPFRHLEPPV